MRNGPPLIVSATLLLAVNGFAAESPTPPSRTAVGVAAPKRIPAPEADSMAPVGEPVATASVPAGVRRAVVADAAKRLQVAESAVVLTRAERVTWSDGSLGCPQPGRLYTQALVPGYRLVAKGAQGELVYHTDQRGNLAACARPLARDR